jgi:hypothetical protein
MSGNAIVPAVRANRKNTTKFQNGQVFCISAFVFRVANSAIPPAIVILGNACDMKMQGR